MSDNRPTAPRVVLINPKATYATEIAQKCFPPLGLLYLAASLESAGVVAEVIDANALRLDDAATVSRASKSSPQLLGIPLYAETLAAAASMIRALRRRLPDTMIVVGGPQASATPGWVLAQVPEVDYVLAGEAEKTLPRLAHMAALSLTPRSGEIEGLVGRQGSPPTNAPPRLTDLDEVPFPRRSCVSEVYDQGLYYALLVADRRIDCMVTSRGCPYQCHFCYNGTRGVRYRKIDSCLDELEGLRTRGIRTIEILDDNFTTSEERALELLERIRRARFGVELRIKARADAVTERLAAAARRAGVYQVSIGAESGSPAILRAMNKGISVSDLRRACRLVMAEGLNCHTNWLLGYPGETPSTLAETAALVQELRPTTAGFTILTPYPGTRVYDQALQAGTLVGEWSVTSSRAPWIRLPWTTDYNDLVAARRALLRRVYFRPHYAFAYARRVLTGANWTLARYAAQELRKTLQRPR